MHFDLLVIGAGIHGTWVARDAVLRGLTVAIIDKGDLGGATSHNSLKTIHGGIRYLQNLDFKRTIESIQEQSRLRKTLSHLVRPVPFVMPLYGYGTRGPVAMWICMQLYYVLCKAFGSGIPRGHLLSRKNGLEQTPGLALDKLSGSASWQELQIEFADRAILEMLHETSQHGATVANYVRADQILSVNNTITGALATDTISDQQFEIKAKTVINAAGPWIESLLHQSGQIKLPVPLTKNINLVLNRNWPDNALGIQSRISSDSRIGKSKRLYFIVPWEGLCIAGTTHFPYRDAVELDTDWGQISEFIDELNRVLPHLQLGLDDVLYCYQGLTPAASEGKSSVHLDHSTVVEHHTNDGIANLYSIVGIKWTTARLVAERAVDEVCRNRRDASPCQTRQRAVPELNTLGWSIDNLSNKELELFCAQHIDHTMAINLSDILLRRCNDLETGRATADTVRTIAKIMSSLLGWSDHELQQQMQALLKAPIAASLRNQLQV